MTLDFPLEQNQFSTIHDASLEVLANTGFRFDCERVRNIFKKNGFKVAGELVYITEKDILSALETIPDSFTIRARNPERDILMNSDTVSIGMGRGAVTILDVDGTHRNACMDDVISTMKLGQGLDILDHIYPFAYPLDVAAPNVHLWSCKIAVIYSDKPYNYFDHHDIDLMTLAYGTNRNELIGRTDLTQSPGHTTVMVHSPLTLTEDDCESLREYAELGIAFHVASMPVACTSGPATTAGTIVLQNCENIAPIVLSQLIRSGCPVFFGALGGYADMASLRPRFGTPEARAIELAGNQMAKYYGLLCRGNIGLTDALVYDFQAGAQAMLSALSVLQDGPNFLTGCGLMGSYVGGSLAKIILDTELLAFAKRYLSPVPTDREALSVDVIHDIEPGGHFIEHPHTLENYRSYSHPDSLFHSPNYQQWAATGKRDVAQLAHEKALRLIESYEKPNIDHGLEIEINEYVEKNWVRG